MAKKKAVEPPKTDIQKQVEDLQKLRKFVSPQKQIEIDEQIEKLTEKA